MKQKIVSKSFNFSIIGITVITLSIIQFKLAETKSLPLFQLSAQDSALNINHQLINTIHLGQKRLIASLIWIDTLMNSDLEHYQQQDLNSWMYHRFNALIELDPQFYEVYRYGGQYLSIVKDDEFGAEDVYSRGLEHFPDDFWLNFHAMFHYLFEMDLPHKAEKLLEKIAYSQTASEVAPYLPSLLLRLKHQSAQSHSDLLFMTLTQLNQLPEKSPFRANLFRSAYGLKAEIDLKCLNEGGKKCDVSDLKGQPYERNQWGVYSAQESWTRFKKIRAKP